jgi:glycosyltransferase involved in cell wall biosynthesis
MHQPALSVVIPTYQRRDVVVETVRALTACPRPGPVEVVVVVDGSTDGTTDALAGLSSDGTVVVVEQPNQGAAAARNTGARRARGPVLLFIDDDMVADPQLLAAHLRRQDLEPGIVLGHIPVHPDSPRTVISDALSRWVEQRRDRLSRPGARPSPSDWLSGQFSIPREHFERLGGFDAALNRQGRFGGEDTDFFHRAYLAGIAFTFAPDADLVRKHPGLLPTVVELHRGNSLLGRASRRLLTARSVRQRALGLVGPRVAALAQRHPTNRVVGRAFIAYRQLEYWAGVADGGGMDVSFRV